MSDILCSESIGPGQIFRSTLEHDLSACVTGIRSEIYHPVGSPYDIRIMFYNHDGMPFGYECIERFQQLLHIIEMQSCSRFVENEHDRQKIAEVWRLASHRFIEAASGNVTAFVDNADPRSVFLSEELPTILQNSKILTINGIDKFQFASQFDKKTSDKDNKILSVSMACSC